MPSLIAAVVGALCYAGRRAHVPRRAAAGTCQPTCSQVLGDVLDDSAGLDSADSFDAALAERVASGEVDDVDTDDFGEYVIEPLDLGEDAADPTGYTPSSERGSNRHEEWDTSRLPLVAIVGRPNVGKSMIVNRISGTFQGGSITYDSPGITRDRSYRAAFWNSKEFRVRAAPRAPRPRARRGQKAASRVCWEADPACPKPFPPPHAP